MPGKGRIVTLKPPSPVPFRHGISNSIEMLRAALDYLDVHAEPHQLAGDSGAAFRVFWPAQPSGGEPGGSWDSAVPGVIAIDPMSAGGARHGWKVLWFRAVSSQVAWQFTCQSLERGKPVLSYGFIGEAEDVLIVGYDRTPRERRLLVLTRYGSTPHWFDVPRAEWPGTDARGTCVGLFERVPPHRRVPSRDGLYRSLRRAVWHAVPRTVRIPEAYHSGFAAYTSWIDALLSAGPSPAAVRSARNVLSAYDLPDPKDAGTLERVGVRHVMHRALTALAEAREWAFAFLTESAIEIDPGKAAAHYEREAEALRSASAFWPAVVMGGPESFSLAPEPEGFEERTRREETVRCLRIAGEELARAAREIDERVPPLPRETDDPIAE